jgi:hypothetical protein
MNMRRPVRRPARLPLFACAARRQVTLSLSVDDTAPMFLASSFFLTRRV